MAMKPNAERMKTAVSFVIENPGTTMRAAIAHVLASYERDETTASLNPASRAARWYKQASSVVERIIKDRHVRQAPDMTLHPWDTKRRTYAEALERAMFAAFDPVEKAHVAELARKAWRAAGDENRARTLHMLVPQSAGTPHSAVPPRRTCPVTDPHSELRDSE